MDRVRLGRVLGRGVRLAGKTATEAVQAATAPSPNPPRGPRVLQGRSAREVVRGRHEPAAARQVNYAQVAAPFRKASRALWHELTGSFFALFAVLFAAAAWKAYGSTGRSFFLFCVLGALFASFSVHSFLRARRAE